MRRFAILLTAFAAALTAMPAVVAASWSHERQGLMLGVGVGGGSADLEGPLFHIPEGISTFGDGESAFWAGRKESGALGLRVGWAFSNRLALGIEGAGWSRKARVEYQTFERKDIDWTFAIATVSVTWYPDGGGLLIRGGAGWGRAEVRIENKGEVGDVTLSTETAHDTGPALLVGLGYEWRLARRLALVPSLDFGAMDLGDTWKANIANVALGLTWYL